MATSNTISITAPPGLVSILIPCCGMLDYTEAVRAELLQHTPRAVRADLPRCRLARRHGGLPRRPARRPRQPDAHRSVPGRHRPGHPRARVKEALQAARGEFVCLLNNDTVVTANWLDAADGAGACSRSARPGRPHVQLRRPAAAGRDGALPSRPEARAQARRAAHRRGCRGRIRPRSARRAAGKWLDAERLGGFCLLIRRVVLDRIGPGLNDVDRPVLFDTDIARHEGPASGLPPGVCRDLFIHHFGTRTFAHGRRRVSPAQQWKCTENAQESRRSQCPRRRRKRTAPASPVRRTGRSTTASTAARTPAGAIRPGFCHSGR